MKRLKDEAEIYAENAVPVGLEATRGWVVEAIEQAYMEGVIRGLKIGKNEELNALAGIESHLKEAQAFVDRALES